MGMAMLDSRWRGGTLPSTYFRQILTKNATKKAQKNYKMATPGLIQGGRGNLLNSHFWRVLKKSHPKSPPKFKMAKWTPKWQHLAQFREGGEIYQILTFGMIWKKSQSKPTFFSKWLRYSILATPGLNREGRGESTKYPLMAYFEKKPPKNGAKMAKTDWQLEFVYRTSDMLVLLPKICRSCCS